LLGKLVLFDRLERRHALDELGAVRQRVVVPEQRYRPHDQRVPMLHVSGQDASLPQL
jgi:hypothetical protein